MIWNGMRPCGRSERGAERDRRSRRSWFAPAALGALLSCVAGAPLVRWHGPDSSAAWALETETEDDDGGEDAIAISFFLPAVEVRPGEIVDVPFQVQSSVPISLLSWTVEYEPDVMTFVEPVLSAPVSELLDGRPENEFRFEWFTSSDAAEGEEPDEPNDDETHETEDEGWLQVVLVTDYAGRAEFSIPADETITVAYLRFAVASDAEEGHYALKFTLADNAAFDGHFESEGQALFNVVRERGAAIDPDAPFSGGHTPDVADGTLFVGPIIGDIGVLRMGDVNRDGEVAISDAVRLLSHLFRGSGPLPCPALGDCNDDLSLDVSDAVVLLTFLFIDRSSWYPTDVSQSSNARFSSPGCR